MEKVLKAYNFGDDFLTWFTVLYRNSCSCVTNNGFISEFFKISRSCRQGDPLSPDLFILEVEPLSASIKNNDNIIGLEVIDVCFSIKLSLERYLQINSCSGVVCKLQISVASVK